MRSGIGTVLWRWVWSVVFLLLLLEPGFAWLPHCYSESHGGKKGIYLVLVSSYVNSLDSSGFYSVWVHFLTMTFLSLIELGCSCCFSGLIFFSNEEVLTELISQLGELLPHIAIDSIDFVWNARQYGTWQYITSTGCCVTGMMTVYNVAIRTAGGGLSEPHLTTTGSKTFHHRNLKSPFASAFYLLPQFRVSVTRYLHSEPDCQASCIF